MPRTELRLLLVTPGVWLVRCRLRLLAGVYLAFVAPIVVSL